MQNETRTCHNFWCNYSTNEPLDDCPKCGRQMLTRDAFKGLGVLLAIIGFILGGGGAALLFFVAPKIRPDARTAIRIVIWGIFGALLAGGLAILGAGITQAITGRRNQTLISVFLVVIFLALFVGSVARSLAG